jgi:uncharacterized protein (DUF1697 family)
MHRWIALFRGINVGGNNILPMAKLTRCLETLHFQNIRTYIQSGNVVFDSASKNARALEKSIGERIQKDHEFLPRLLLLSLNDLQAAIHDNPFPEAISNPKSLHFFFLEKPAAKPNLQALDAAKATMENYRLTDRVFYLLAPAGVGRSKLAASAEKHLGVMTTARNYRTVEKLLALASAG